MQQQKAFRYLTFETYQQTPSENTRGHVYFLWSKQGKLLSPNRKFSKSGVLSLASGEGNVIYHKGYEDNSELKPQPLLKNACFSIQFS